MEQLQHKANITDLLNIDSLRGRLSLSPHLDPELIETIAPISSNLDLTSNWPSDLLFTDLGNDSPFNSIFKILKQDVIFARDKLVALNQGRRTLVERRMEYIARKIARTRNERFQRTLSLTEILKDSFRDFEDLGLDPHSSERNWSEKPIGLAAWESFTAEVALYHLLNLFVLKCLDSHGWRKFELSDLNRMNFTVHSFLNQKASGFAHDKHSWNFVRSNLYSWHTLSTSTIELLSEKVKDTKASWSDSSLFEWVKQSSNQIKLNHLELETEEHVADISTHVLKNLLNTSLTSKFQGRTHAKKVFIPNMELGGVAHRLLDTLLANVDNSFIEADNSYQESPLQIQIQKTFWGCENECFEIFWTEVLSLLKVIRWSNTTREIKENYRIPNFMHAVQMLGLELHNLDQLPLGGPDLSKLQHGSAGQIQQTETFDISIVTDHPDRAKSIKWMTALASQIPYWRSLVSSSTCLNWGELHLFLALTKLKDNGTCIYFSHRNLPDGGDGEKLRKSILSQSTLEYFFELNEEFSNLPYRYIYVFKKISNKLERDQHHPKFGKFSYKNVNNSKLEESSSSQIEIAERGWDHLFVRGAAPLIRHLNNKFPKLFQLASLQSGQELYSMSTADDNLFTNKNTKSNQGDLRKFHNTNCIQAKAIENGNIEFSIQNIQSLKSKLSKELRELVFIFPHNPLDLPWVYQLLKSPVVNFWIKHQIFTPSQGRSPKLTDLRSIPVLDLSHTSTESINEAVSWITKTNPNIKDLIHWLKQPGLAFHDRQARFIALSKRYRHLETIQQRYDRLFTKSEPYDLKPESVPEFYPDKLLHSITQSPLIRIQYLNRELTSVLPENWIIDEILGTITNQVNSFVTLHTRQGPRIQISLPTVFQEYMVGQLKLLKDHTWVETLGYLRVPADVQLFSVQTNEITKVFRQTVSSLKILQEAINFLSLDLFEIPKDMQSFIEIKC